MSDDEGRPELRKTLFGEDRFRHVASETKAVYPAFDDGGFLALTLPEIPALALMARLDLMTRSLRATLPADYRKALAVLRALAPRIDNAFVTLALPRFVALYGLHDVAVSLDALAFFTRFGSSEFAVREFLKRDLAGTLAVMRGWARDPDEHVRRLASEGCRPRLPWSFRLDTLIADPAPALPILETLRADPSLYVRKSVANHLNDITKDRPELVLEIAGRWPRENPHTVWIVKRALRTLVKKGDVRALAYFGAGDRASVRVDGFAVSPAAVTLGGNVTLALSLTSTAKKPQTLVVDYVVHYVKASGATSEKVFKWKSVTLAPGETVRLTAKRPIRDFSTRKHYPGKHRVELVVNGGRPATAAFFLHAT